MAQSRHPDRVGECPLSGVKRTSKFKSVTSAFDPKRICAACPSIQAATARFRKPVRPRKYDAWSFNPFAIEPSFGE